MSEREEELSSIQAIYPEIVISGSFTASLQIPVAPAEPVHVHFEDSGDTILHYLPPLKLDLELPETYPDSNPPNVTLSTAQKWLPLETVQKLQNAVTDLWEEYGRCQVLFLYIDYLQQCIDQLGDITISAELESSLKEFDKDTRQAIFDAGTYDCGICLEPKKGKACYKLDICGHIFCKQCSLDFYNNAITEGDVGTVRCLDPECGKAGKGSKRSLHPRELLAIGLDEAMARRYVVMKRKKKMESDKTTIFCPRTWCQQPARSVKYPPIPANLLEYPEEPEVDDDKQAADVVVHPAVSTTGEDERLAVCEACKFAFCRTCSASWHGSFVRCYPRNASELTAEEKASYDYIMSNTSPCPTCSSPISKTMGCNHMSCYQCHTHFCYLCGAWLDPGSPYTHFNTAGTSCYQRLWELEEGDNGQAPEDGRGFGGARAMEAMALEAARAAQREEDEAAAAIAAAGQGNDAGGNNNAAQAVRGENNRVGDPRVEEVMAAIRAEDDPFLEEQIERMVQRMVDDGLIDLNGRPARPPAPRPPRRPRNPFPANPRAQGAAAAVRAHERGGRNPRVRQAMENEHEDELRRFVDLALRDEEDGWDSDELDDNDAGWRIR